MYLLWHDALPNAAQLSEFKQALAEHRTLPQITLDVLQAAAAKDAPDGCAANGSQHSQFGAGAGELRFRHAKP